MQSIWWSQVRFVFFKKIKKKFYNTTSFKALFEVGGVESFINKFSYAISSSTLYSNLSCGLPNSDYFDLLRDADSDFPWPGMSFGKVMSSNKKSCRKKIQILLLSLSIIGMLITGVWYWCSE